VPNVEKPFSTLTVEERDQMLTEIDGNLHYMALVSSAVHDDTARQMDALSQRIDREHEKLAADDSARSGAILHEALELMDVFQERMSL